MDSILERPHLIAYFAGTIFPFTCFFSYVLALALNHIGLWITYISDASTDPPVSGVFGMLLTYSMIAFLASTYVRKKLVECACEERPEIATSKVRLANHVSGWLALTSVICLIFVAHFQVHTTMFLHGTMAFIGIGLGVLYCFLQVGPYFEAFPNSTYMNANPAILSKIWMPDVYTDYTKSVVAPRILAAPASLRIYPNTTVRYSARITMQFACPMDFRNYPADSQSCDMSLESYAFTRDKIYYSWRPEGASINIAHRLAHFDFAFTFENDKENVNFPSGSYPAITMTVRLHRRISYHMLQTYIPSLMFVIVSWLSFLVPPESVPGRMAICMTTLLTLTAMFAAVRQSTPSVSYVKALDIWMVACVFFVFLTLVEYTLVLRLTKNLKKSQTPPTSPRKNEPNTKPSPLEMQMQPSKNGDEQSSAFHKFSGEAANGPPSTDSPKNCLIACVEGYGPDCWRRPTKRGILILETVSCIFIPGSFIFFNIVYWSYLASIVAANMATTEI